MQKSEGLSSREADQLDRVLRSHTLQGSTSLCKLLQFLVAASTNQQERSVNEYQIATEVLGRKDSFDPRLDSGARVHLARLRSKLIEYFATEGSGDTLTIDIPKGSYKVVFSPRALPVDTETATKHEAAQASLSEALAPMPSTVAGDQRTPHSSIWRRTPVLVSFFLLGSAITFLATRLSIQTAAPELTQPPAALKEFWRPFLGKGSVPLIVFGNNIFAVDPGKGLRLPAAAETGALLTDLYTGVGEVVGVNELGLLLARMNRSVQVKRANLLSLDEVQERDAIFVGAWGSNPDIGNLLPPVEGGAPQWAASPPPELGRVGQPPGIAAYTGESPSDARAIISLTRGVRPQHWVMVLAGTTTLGTQAAVDFACRPETVSALLKQLGPDGVTKPFRCTLRYRVAKGVPLEPSIIEVKRVK